MPTIRLIASLLAVITFGLSVTASAQTTPVRLRGAITAIDGKTVTIAVRDSSTANVKLADNWAVGLVVPASMSDIKRGTSASPRSARMPIAPRSRSWCFRTPCVAPAKVTIPGTSSRRA